MNTRAVFLHNDRAIIGRGSKSDKERAVHSGNLLFCDRTISREHALLQVIDGDIVVIKDCGSRHGVVVNGVLLDRDEPWELALDDWIGLVTVNKCGHVEQRHCKLVLGYRGFDKGLLFFDVVKPVDDENEHKHEPEHQREGEEEEEEEETTLHLVPYKKRPREDDDVDDNNENSQKRVQLKRIHGHLVSGLIGIAVGATLGAGITFSTLLSVGRSLG
jgi:hypothetical protein